MDVLKQLGSFLSLSLLAAASAVAQISPGPLSKGHEALDGMTNCTSCHERGAEIGMSKCLGCHTEIAALLDKKHGMHARSAGTACNDCHKEHLGRDASITRFSPTAFDHKESGFDLSGKHKGIECSKCHGSKSFQAEKTALPKNETKTTFLGLRSECGSCHEDRHKGTVGPDCRQCHTTSGWTPITNFDHTKTQFSLSGKHKSVDCVKCHLALKETPRPAEIIFSTNVFADCTPCHMSPHKPEFSRNRLCHDCHTTEGWKSTKGFDHSVTRFPLIGRHTSVPCEQCHSGMKNRKVGQAADFSTKPFANCVSCHKSPHAEPLNRTTCSSCHTPIKWKSVHNRTFDHDQTDFLLRGKHVSVTCEGCHQSDQTTSFAVQYRAKPKCTTCHQDVHKGVFDNRYGDCADCHTEHGFVPSTFTVENHSRGRFPLTGAHGALLCTECHAKKDSMAVFVFKSILCGSCHLDYHQGVFQKIMGTDGCVKCHTPAAWNRVVFDHQLTKFPLVGKHASVSCALCHKQSKGPVRYQGTPPDCASCHQDPHVKQFVQGGTTRCENCHTSRSWRMLIFDHETQSSFRLTGAHGNVPCGACHREERSPRGPFVRFKPLPQSCEGCHQGKR